MLKAFSSISSRRRSFSVPFSRYCHPWASLARKRVHSSFHRQDREWRTGLIMSLQNLTNHIVNSNTTVRAIRNTCKKYSQDQLQSQIWNAVIHVLIMYTNQQIWLQWIEDRFANKSLPPRCERDIHNSFLASQRYASDPNWILKGKSALFKLTMPWEMSNARGWEYSRVRDLDIGE